MKLSDRWADESRRPRSCEFLHFGLKGRFSQPSPKGWDENTEPNLGPERAVRRAAFTIGVTVKR
jgi:hypothetical protein